MLVLALFKNFQSWFFQENLNGTFTYASSCDEYFQQGDRSNGSFLIRPNPGLGSKFKYNLECFPALNLKIFIPFFELHAFEVECEFTEFGGRTVIKSVDWNENGFIFPKSEEERCTDPDCFSHIFKYPVSKDQFQVCFIFSYSSYVHPVHRLLLINQSHASRKSDIFVLSMV